MVRYAEILVDVANRRLDRSYHYLVPTHLPLREGMTVIVPLKNRKVQGLVVKITLNPPEIEGDYKLRAIDSILEEQSLIPSELLELANWLAETTICPVAQALHTVWPFLKGKAENWIIPMVGIQEEDVQVLKLLDPDTYKVLAVLNRARKGGVPERLLHQRTNASKNLIEDMIRQGWIRSEVRFSRAGNLTKSDSKADSSNSDSLDNIPNIDELENYSDKPENYSPSKESVVLNHEQNNAVEDIWSSYLNRDSQTVLLHGVTGSGKTEVYREVVSRVLQEGGDVILLVPEISLTSQIAKVFLKEFGDIVGLIHSGIKINEKLNLWQKILGEEKRIVIGARSAVFAPLKKLSLIILDEEHDNAYKQDENPKYHARDVARKRMELRKGLVVLGSATPSLEAYAAAQREVIKLVTINQRFNRSALPAVEIVDMKQELAQGNKSMFSYALRSKLEERITRGEQSILFLNRRGYSTFVFCRECGYVAKCPHCDVSLTYHNHKQDLRCHYCGYQQDVFHNCPECGSRYIRFYGQGTQKVEEEVSALFPGIEVLRLDTDTAAEKHKDVLERFRKQEVPILVGTQMLSKGLDFPNVTLVGVISADQLLNMPDFRSRERAFQLLTQVAGRAGRAHKPGEVIVQTYSPEDPAIIQAAKHDYRNFFWEEIAYRKERKYPPFAHIIRVLVFHEKEENAIKAAHQLAGCIKRSQEDLKVEDYHILGPAPAVMSKLKNKFRWQVSVKGKNPEILRKIVYKGVRLFYKDTNSSGINLSIEVNPLSF
ncbi:MAG: primosomal protein N' [Gracilibacter sp. BRH_c7a]|nr:MAG: primosomal protein N' [Gracilibacter sp. BRH_c7a]